MNKSELVTQLATKDDSRNELYESNNDSLFTMPEDEIFLDAGAFMDTEIASLNYAGLSLTADQFI